MVYLQKSQFSNIFNTNYGYIINAIPLNGLAMHIFNGLGSLNIDEDERIKELLDLDSNISNVVRKSELKKLLLEKIVSKVSSVNTEEDVLEELQKLSHLNNIPLVVKRHFNLPE